MFSDIILIWIFDILVHFFSLYSVDMTSSKYHKFYSRMCGDISTQLSPGTRLCSTLPYAMNLLIYICNILLV